MAGAGVGLPPPPYQLRNATFMVIGGKLDPTDVRQMLPDGLEPAEGGYGALLLYEAPEGWAIAPYTAFFAFIEVAGYPTPDGSNARYQVRGYYSGKAGSFITAANRNMEFGQARILRDGDIAVGHAGPTGRETISLSMRLTGARHPATYGSNYYLCEPPSGGRTLIPVSYVLHHHEVLEPTFEIKDDAHPRLRPFSAMKPEWATYFPGTVFTIGEPRSIATGKHNADAEQARVALLNVFTQVGKGAAIAGPAGELLLVNERARSYLGDCLVEVHGKVRAVDPRSQRELAAAVHSVAGRGASRLSTPVVAVERPDGRKPVLVQVLPVSPATGEHAVILLMTDPDSPPEGDVTQALQLLGLTPAEARTASLVGTGLSPREAAEEAGNTENTTRFILKQVYEKLGIGRQSELAQLVARLQAFAAG